MVIGIFTGFAAGYNHRADTNRRKYPAFFSYTGFGLLGGLISGLISAPLVRPVHTIEHSRYNYIKFHNNVAVHRNFMVVQCFIGGFGLYHFFNGINERKLKGMSILDL